MTYMKDQAEVTFTQSECPKSGKKFKSNQKFIMKSFSEPAPIDFFLFVGWRTLATIFYAIRLFMKASNFLELSSRLENFPIINRKTRSLLARWRTTTVDRKLFPPSPFSSSSLFCVRLRSSENFPSMLPLSISLRIYAELYSPTRITDDPEKLRNKVSVEKVIIMELNFPWLISTRRFSHAEVSLSRLMGNLNFVFATVSSKIARDQNIVDASH